MNRNQDIEEKAVVDQHNGHEPLKETTHEAAERGHVATDIYGNALITFDPQEEKRLRRKIDIYIIPTVFLLYLFAFIDRANIGNARLAGFEEDLGMDPESFDFSTVLSMFYVSYIIFEIPANMACKVIGPGWFIPATTLGFGISSLGTGFVRNMAGACGVRFLLGLFEAGMLPGIAYYLSRWYRRKELAFRLSLYIVAAPLAGAFGGLLASAILTLDHFGSLHSWRMIFGIEGIITICLSLIGFFTLTDRPETARWLTDAEKDLAIARVKSERVSTTEVLDKLNTKKIILGIFNPVVLSTAFIFLLNNITVNGLAFFAPTIVATIYPDAPVVQLQLHTVPPYVVGAFTVVVFSYISTVLDKRIIIMLCSAPFMVIGYIIFLATENPQARYGASHLITLGAFSFGSLCNAQSSANVVSDTARSSAIGTTVMLGNLGGLVSTWSYLPGNAPNFPVGNGLNLATSTTTWIVALLILIYMKADNRRRDKKDIDAELSGLDDKQIQALDWKHPGFRWRP